MKPPTVTDLRDLLRPLAIPKGIPACVITSGKIWMRESEWPIWRQAHDRFTASIPGAKLGVASESDHMIQERQPEVVADPEHPVGDPTADRDGHLGPGPELGRQRRTADGALQGAKERHVLGRPARPPWPHVASARAQRGPVKLVWHDGTTRIPKPQEKAIPAVAIRGIRRNDAEGIHSAKIRSVISTVVRCWPVSSVTSPATPASPMPPAISTSEIGLRSPRSRITQPTSSIPPTGRDAF